MLPGPDIVDSKVSVILYDSAIVKDFLPQSQGLHKGCTEISGGHSKNFCDYSGISMVKTFFRRQIEFSLCTILY